MTCTLSTQLVFFRPSALLLWKPDIGFEVEISGMVDEWLMEAVKGYLVMAVSGLERCCGFPYGYQQALLYCARNCKCQMPYQTEGLLPGQKDICSNPLPQISTLRGLSNTATTRQARNSSWQHQFKQIAPVDTPSRLHIPQKNKHLMSRNLHGFAPPNVVLVPFLRPIMPLPTRRIQGQAPTLQTDRNPPSAL